MTTLTAKTIDTPWVYGFLDEGFCAFVAESELEAKKALSYHILRYGKVKCNLALVLELIREENWGQLFDHLAAMCPLDCYFLSRLHDETIVVTKESLLKLFD